MGNVAAAVAEGARKGDRSNSSHCGDVFKVSDFGTGGVEKLSHGWAAVRRA